MNWLVLLLASTLAIPLPASAQSVREQNSKALRQYQAPRVITTLEWDLLQFNQMWVGSYPPGDGYLVSFPVFFDYRQMRFHITLPVAEKREYRDPEPWATLPKTQKLSILQGAIDHAIRLLETSFPEVRTRPSTVIVDFKYGLASGGQVSIGKYENGTLSLVE